MQQEQQIIEREERESVIASMADDSRYYLISPEFHLPWLIKTYNQKIANEIIEATYQALKEQPK